MCREHKKAAASQPAASLKIAPGWYYFFPATSSRVSALCNAFSDRSTSTLASPLASRCSARTLALRARSTSMSAGRSADLGQNRHFVGQHFCKSPGHCKPLLLSPGAERDFADSQFRDQRRMPRQDAQIPVLAGNLNFRRSRVHDFLFRRDDLELESIGHQ